MISSTERVVDGPWMGLTGKQCEVLDLVIQHKTSKEISRLLGISPHTVDQRIMLARAKLNVATRAEVAQAYRTLLAQHGKFTTPAAYQRTVYGSSYIALPPRSHQDGCREDADTALAPLHPDNPAGIETQPQQMARPVPDAPTQEYYHVLPEAFDGRIGTLLRLGAIATITVFLTLVILGGLAIYSELSLMLDS